MNVSRVTDMPCHEMGSLKRLRARVGGLSLVGILERGMLEEKKRGEERKRDLYRLGSAPMQQASAACGAGRQAKGRVATCEMASDRSLQMRGWARTRFMHASCSSTGLSCYSR